jgi:hypothetical protein
MADAVVRKFGMEEPRTFLLRPGFRVWILSDARVLCWKRSNSRPLYACSVDDPGIPADHANQSGVPIPSADRCVGTPPNTGDQEVLAGPALRPTFEDLIPQLDDFAVQSSILRKCRSLSGRRAIALARIAHSLSISPGKLATVASSPEIRENLRLFLLVPPRNVCSKSKHANRKSCPF